MISAPAPWMARITSSLPLIEKILLSALAIGVILKIMSVDSGVTKISMIGLGITFFLYAYRSTYIPGQENEPFGFSALLGLMIVPKVLWISSAISALGIAIYLIDFGNEGYKQLLIIGGSTIAVAVILFACFMAGGVKHMKVVAPILVRSIPLLLIDLFICLNSVPFFGRH